MFIVIHSFLPFLCRGCSKATEISFGKNSSSNKEIVNKLHAKDFKVNPLKLSLGSTQINVPIGM